MPPVQKITKEMILEAGYQLVLEKGLESLNSRNAAQVLSCSTQPVFSQFPTMEQLRQQVHDYACTKFEQEVMEDAKEGTMLKSGYLKMIELAKEKKNIFKMIYLSDYCNKSNFIEMRMGYESNQKILAEIKNIYKLNDEESKNVMERISIFVHGIATLIATADIEYTNEEVIALVESTLRDMVAGVKFKGNSKLKGYGVDGVCSPN